MYRSNGELLCDSIAINMKTLIILAVFLCTESGLCFFMDIKNAIKSSRRSFDIQEYQALERLLDTKFQGFLSRRDSIDKKRNEELSLDEVASKTFFKSSGLTAINTTVIEVTTVPSVAILWLFNDIINNEWVFTRGDVITDEDKVTTSFTMGDDIDSVLFCILGSDFVTSMFARKSLRMNVMSKPLSSFTGLCNGPFNVTMADDGTLDLDFKTSIPYAELLFGGFVTNFVSNGSETYLAGDVADLQIEQTSTQGMYHATGNVGGLAAGKQYWTRFYIPGNMIPFQNPFRYVGVIKRVLIEEVGQTEDDSVTLNFGRINEFGPLQLKEGFEYGGLCCIAAGHPAPTVEMFKGDQRLSTSTGSYLQLVSYAFVSFEGQSVNNVTGTYKCQATSGTMSVDREYIVKKYELPN